MTEIIKEGFLEAKLEENCKSIQIKLIFESEEFCKKIFEAIEEDGISIFDWRWGHHGIRKSSS